MSLALLVAASIGWQFAASQDPLGQSVYVAALVPDEARPHVGLRFSCGGIVGVQLTFNLGELTYSDKQLSDVEPEWEDVRFLFGEGPYDTTAKRAPITEGIGTYEIKGSDAAFVAGLLQSGGQVEIIHDDAKASFSLDGAGLAIGEVIEACPFKYPGQ